MRECLSIIREGGEKLGLFFLVFLLLKRNFLILMKIMNMIQKDKKFQIIRKFRKAYEMFMPR